MNVEAPGIDDIRALRERIANRIVETPTVRCRALEALVDDEIEIWGKLEFLQRTGTFKPRGALANLMELDEEQRARGVTAVSAGNHAIATAYAAQAVGASAKVVMIRSASPARVASCRQYGAEVVMADDVHAAFSAVERIREDEGRVFVHPFEGPNVALGTGTVGLEICEQVDDFDAIVIPVGGGGLCGGMSNAVRQLNPGCDILGIEPAGADSMRRSFESGQPETLDRVDTVADSLGAPFALPYSFELCRRNVDELALVTDRQMREAMGVLFRHMKIAVEPACAASTAALLGPLRERLKGRKVVLMFCGSNIDWQTFESLVIMD